SGANRPTVFKAKKTPPGGARWAGDRWALLAPFHGLWYSVFNMISTAKKADIVKKHGLHDKDTGSSAVQIALLSEAIDDLTEHLKVHRKDNHSRKGLLAMVADRRSHIKYLEKKDPKTLESLLKKLKLKK
ncbi:MAG TPA: 30S ribosomal protein S15, partial [Nitrososphaera sp.]|nr:30S ribosomal protein S15 [Nitrososphaera sp.]